MALRLDPRMPEPDACVQRNLLDRLAARQPEKVFANFADGTEWTYRQTREIAIRAANALRRLGVKQGERVLVWLPNSADCLRVWFGLNYLGAVFVPINLAYRGNLLQHTVNVSEARLGIIHADLHQRLGEVELKHLREIVVLGGEPAAVRGLDVRWTEALECDDDSPPALEREIAPWDLQSIIFTSGTTGPSKGVLSSYVHLYNMAIAAPFLSVEDRYMLNLPLFHSGGVMPTTAMLIHGGSIAMVDAFDTDTFWDTVRKRGITTSILLGVMGGFLLKRPPSPEDKNHLLRTCTYVPLNETARQFHERFGTEIYTHFNMTEISQPIVSAANPTALGSAGRPRPGVEVRIVDENDCELGSGEVGELVVRTDCPWAVSHGYAGNPEATAAAWRNGWFHTGDGFKRDAEGNFYFVDRLKDAIRRRGENISSFEVESEILAHPAVREAAAVVVKSEIAEDEVMAVIAVKPGETLDPAELIEFLRPRMAHFMIPRYVRFVEALPRTPTAKIEKVKLRALGLTDDAWDREKAGIQVKREKIGQGDSLMLPELTPRAQTLREKLAAFMAEHIYPHEKELIDEAHQGSGRWRPRARMEDLKRQARRQGLWNLFYTHGPEGPGLSNYEYGHLCEVLGRSLAAPEVFNCNAPDVGNMEILSLFGTAEQKARWLSPLLAGEIRSCFAMTEPAVASSDATNIETSIRRDGDDYVIDGRKWWITGAMNAACKFAIVMGKSDPAAPKHKQQSMILAPLDSPGLTVERALSVYGYEHPPLGHAELVFDGVRVPAANMLLGEGRGFEIAQSRLGPGRIHHCMRFIGLAERAIEAMCRRAKARIAFGAPLAEQGAVRQAIGQSRCDVEQARLVTLKAAATMDRLGPKAARHEIAVAKIVVPETVGRILDRAIQVHGGAGLSQDHFLAAAFAETRFLRIGDGPDEVHREALAKAELAKYA